MKDKRRKKDVRRLTARHGVSYTTGLRMLETQERLALGADDMLGRLRAFLAERPLNRLWLVHGFESGGVEVLDADDPSLGVAATGVRLRIMQPVVWEVEPRVYPARASDVPTRDEVDNLHMLLSNYIDGGGFGRARLADWRVERNESQMPSAGTARDAQWTVTATIVAV